MNAPNEFKVLKLKEMVQLPGRKGQKPTLLVQGNITCLFVLAIKHQSRVVLPYNC